MATPETLLTDTAHPAQHDLAARPRAATIAIPWQRAALGAILVLSAFLNFWQLDRIGYGNTYYAAAVRSMLESWHNFFFNSFDPGGFVTIDKPPLGFWLQVASAKLFGYNGISLMLPQAIAGVLSVAVLYRLVSRTFGTGAGLLAALALAVMPVSVAASRNNIIDGTLALVILLGAWAVLRAAETGKLRWLLLCAVLVGLGFNIKMLEAYLVVPAFGLLYLLAAPVKWPVRLGHLAAATLVLLVISFSWAVAVDATPASQRPYVGSSSTNSEINLALGYNGLERLTGRIFGRGRAPATRPAAANTNGNPGGSNTQTSTQRANANGFTRGETGNPGPFRLFNSALGGQVSWLLPLAVLGLIAAAWRTRLSFPFVLDRRQQSLVLWGAWLAVQATFFSVAGFFHSYYMVMMAPSIAALAGIGLSSLWQDYRAPGWRGWMLPVVVLVTAAVQVYLLTPYPDWSRWLSPLVVGLSVIAAIGLVVRRLGARFSLRLALGAAAVGTIGLLAAPAAWAADTTLRSTGSMTPTAGPSPRVDRGGFPGLPQGTRNRIGDAFAGRFGGGFDREGTANTTLIRYLEENQGRTRYLLATLNSMTAAPIIISTGKPVMALGGFSGADRIVTPSDLSKMVANNTVRFFLLQGGDSFRSLNPNDLPPQWRDFLERQGNRAGGFGGFGGNADLTQWVSSNCAVVPTSLWQGPSISGGSTQGTGPGFGFGRGGEQLYDCARRPGTQSRAAAGSNNTTTAPAPSHTTAPASSAVLMGRWVSGTGSSITIQGFGGQQSLPVTSGTRYEQVVTASAQALQTGQRVAIVPDRANSSTAASITIAPANGPFISVRAFGFGASNRGSGSGGYGGRGGSGNGGYGSGGYGNGSFGGRGAPGGTGGTRRLRQTAITGTITALTGNAVTIKTTAGTTRTLALSSSTAVYHAVAATPAQFQDNAFVAVGTASIGGRQVAVDIVQAANGAIPTIITPGTGAATGRTV